MNKFSIFIVATIVALSGSKAFALGPEVDPDVLSTWTITCTDPIEREDGTPLEIGEIATRNFFVSTDQTTWTPAGSNNTECKQVYDLTDVPDGQYYYTATAVDTDGRESAYSPDMAALVVKRIQPPNPPSGLTGTAS